MKMTILGGIAMKEFDLNIEKILEDWEVYHAVREIIANAIDEQIITGTKDIQIYKENDCWHIVDFGRGLNYHHLTQNENVEKTNSDELIGRFGVGLKDALATFYRNGITVTAISKYGIITLKQAQKSGFDDILTLHAQIDESPNKEMVGTDFCLQGCSDSDINKAKKLFLKFANSEVLEKTPYGEVISKEGPEADIYINGVKVAQEYNFLFSYNITSLNSQIKKALNRERTNVGRSAYTPRVKDILKKCTSERVLSALINDFQGYETGVRHDEVTWSEIEMYATIELSKKKENTAFVTPKELQDNPDMIDEIKRSGYEPVVVSNNLKNKITDYNSGVNNGNVLRTTNVYYEEEKKKFVPTPVSISSLSDNEYYVFSKLNDILNLIGGKPYVVKSIEVVEQLYESTMFLGGTVGLWVPSEHIIYIKRSQLRSLKDFAGTLLHECAHAMSGASDVSRDFELMLTDIIGKIADLYLKG